MQFNPVGQVVGQLNSVEKTAAVIQRLVEEYLDAVDGLTVPAQISLSSDPHEVR